MHQKWNIKFVEMPSREFGTTQTVQYCVFKMTHICGTASITMLDFCDKRSSRLSMIHKWSYTIFRYVQTQHLLEEAFCIFGRKLPILRKSHPVFRRSMLVCGVALLQMHIGKAFRIASIYSWSSLGGIPYPLSTHSVKFSIPSLWNRLY